MVATGVTVVVADPQPVMRLGLRRTLTRMTGVAVVAETGDAQRVPELVDTFRPDILILELAFPGRDGLSLIDELASRAAAPRMLVYTAMNAFTPILRAFAFGASGAVSKLDDVDRLYEAVEQLRQRRPYIPPELVEPVLTRRLDRNAPRDPVDSLTNRELEVMRRLAQGQANGTIAKSLGISPATVASHRNKILRKLALRNNADLARFATQAGLC